MHTTYVRMQLDRQRAEARHRRLQRHQSKAKAVRAKLADCCRKLTAFFFTQIGVCGLIVGYTIIGAFMFIALESGVQQPMTQDVIARRRSCVDYLWNVTHHLNVLNYDQWRQDVNRTVYEYQMHMVRHIRRGYDGLDENPDVVRWTIPAALMYCITIYTTIGYGNLTPRTGAGKLASVVYALFGIPLMLLYMANVGDILATSFKYTYKKMCKCPRRRQRATPKEKPPASASAAAAAAAAAAKATTAKADGEARPRLQRQASVIVDDEPLDLEPQTVSVTSCLFVIGSFVVFGAVLFGVWEGWGYVDGSYFCFTSLLTIGFGDFVPGQVIYRQSEVGKSQDEIDGKLIFCAIYLLLGMALLAMCFNLMQEEVFMKIKRFGRRLGLLRERFGS